jgi:hypothetical protein
MQQHHQPVKLDDVALGAASARSMRRAHAARVLDGEQHGNGSGCVRGCQRLVVSGDGLPVRR